jgi:CheY-like chemotaxis protein
VRTRYSGSILPAIALTAYAADSDRLKTALAGFQAYLAKPVEPQALISVVFKWAQPLSKAAPQSATS